MIKPSIGRVLWLYSGRSHFADGNQPYSAQIVYVHLDSRVVQDPQTGRDHLVEGGRFVNVAWYDHNGEPHARLNTWLVQEGEAPPEEGWFCTWMPFQIGQAKSLNPATGEKVQSGGNPKADQPTTVSTPGPQAA